jgi:hypothetical protein
MIKLSSAVTPPLYLGFDPGKDKCGLALVDSQKIIHWHEVILTAKVTATLETIRQTIPIDCVILGDQTHSKYWQNILQTTLPSLKIVTIDERYSSLEARSRYWNCIPPPYGNGLFPKAYDSRPDPWMILWRSFWWSDF